MFFFLLFSICLFELFLYWLGVAAQHKLIHNCVQLWCVFCISQPATRTLQQKPPSGIRSGASVVALNLVCSKMCYYLEIEAKLRALARTRTQCVARITIISIDRIAKHSFLSATGSLSLRSLIWVGLESATCFNGIRVASLTSPKEPISSTN